jgi:hypothetical protein
MEQYGPGRYKEHQWDSLEQKKNHILINTIVQQLILT